MTSRILHSPDEVDAMAKILRARTKWPIRVQVTEAKEARTAAQNRTLHMWFGEIARELGDSTAEEVKAHCNLTYGRPIMARDDEEWQSAFGYIFDSLNHASKLKAIRVLDLPFTRRMNVDQLSEYMEQMQRDYREMGIFLTDPELRGYEELKR